MSVIVNALVDLGYILSSGYSTRFDGEDILRNAVSVSYSLSAGKTSTS